MSGELEGLEYRAPDKEGARDRGSRGPVREMTGWRSAKLVVAMLLGVGGIMALVVPERPWIFEAMRQTPVEQALPLPDGGLLADVRGEDPLHRLAVTQAALKREMALLRERVSGEDESEGAPSAEMDVVRALANLEAKNAMFRGHVVRLEAGQTALRDEIRRLETALVTLGELSGELHRLEEGN